MRMKHPLEERGALYWKPRENIFYLVGKSRELPLISPVKDYSDPAIRSLREERNCWSGSVWRELKFPEDSNPISVTVPTRFPQILPRTDRLIRFLRLRCGITALSTKLFWNRVYDANGLVERPVGRLIFLFDNESAFRNLFARPTEHLGGIGHFRVIQWSLRGDYAAFSRRPRRFLTTLLQRKLIFALNVLFFAPLISNLRRKQLHHLRAERLIAPLLTARALSTSPSSSKRFSNFLPCYSDKSITTRWRQPFRGLFVWEEHWDHRFTLPGELWKFCPQKNEQKLAL